MHLFLVYHMPARKLNMFVDWCNNRKYEYIGRLRKGYNRPFVSITPFGLDIRIKEECAAQFLSDIGAYDLTWKHLYNHLFINRNIPKFFTELILWCVIKFVRLVTPLKKIKFEPDRKFEGWANLWFVGAIKDPTRNGNEVL